MGCHHNYDQKSPEEINQIISAHVAEKIQRSERRLEDLTECILGECADMAREGE